MLGLEVEWIACTLIFHTISSTTCIPQASRTFEQSNYKNECWRHTWDSSRRIWYHRAAAHLFCFLGVYVSLFLESVRDAVRFSLCSFIPSFDAFHLSCLAIYACAVRCTPNTTHSLSQIHREMIHHAFFDFDAYFSRRGFSSFRIVFCYFLGAFHVLLHSEHHSGCTVVVTNESKHI